MTNPRDEYHDHLERRRLADEEARERSWEAAMAGLAEARAELAEARLRAETPTTTLTEETAP